MKKVLPDNLIGTPTIVKHFYSRYRENNLANVVTLKKGRLEDIDLPFDKVDAIVSEWMGYFLLFEGMLDTVIFARDNYLSPGGKLLPNRCNISIVGSGDTSKYEMRREVSRCRILKVVFSSLRRPLHRLGRLLVQRLRL